jgi:hypothetical protein
MTSYDEVCAYASVRINEITGGRSADHFAAKSSALNAAYEWSNYRLACRLMNARKSTFDDVLDPFTIAPGTFELMPLTGGLIVSPALTGQAAIDAGHTRDRLRLDDGAFRKVRLRYIDWYLAGDISERVLKQVSPFIWAELQRLGIRPP